jgi:mono/diheme cytochrome c family protein
MRPGETRPVRPGTARVIGAFALLLLTAPRLSAQADIVSSARTGRDVFMGGCVTCHGPDGRGTPKSTLGFEPPPTFPDFTDCVATAREPDRDWRAIITHGGPARGFSPIMPSFRELLASHQIDLAIEFLRTFCREPAWPRGELNLPRALTTEKAFLEDEIVLTSAINLTGEHANGHTISYEKRFGVRNQLELALPFGFQQQAEGDWAGSIGDIALGYKRLLFSRLKTGSILSVQGEVILPTGNSEKGFGTGVTVFEGFASYGQLLPGQSFLQFQAGIELPRDTGRASRAAYWRTVLGKSLFARAGLGRVWTPMVEILADRELVTGATTDWDLVPQMQVTLNARQHVRAGFGLRLPVNDSASRSKQVMFYLLWDWFDGGFLEGWK